MAASEISAATAYRLHAPLPAGNAVWSYEISGDSEGVVYLVEEGASLQLYRASIDGGDEVVLNDSLVAGGNEQAVVKGSGGQMPHPGFQFFLRCATRRSVRHKDQIGSV